MAGEQVEYEAGDIIFKEGEEGIYAYILEEGSVELSKADRGRLQISEIIREGVFGLLPLIDNKPRQFTARARTKVRLTPICKDRFAKRMEASDPVVQSVVRVLTKSFREATDRLSSGGVIDVDRGDAR